MIENLSDYFNFQRARWSGKITCPERPHFESKECTIFFEEQLKRSRVYLEYGSGGSSVLAASLGIKTFSVDSDKLFQNKVRETLLKCSIDSNAPISLIYADIGFTREWGNPVFTDLTPRRLAKWRSYVTLPWEQMHDQNVRPDLVLIDGRFRAACALQSLRNLASSDEAMIIVDDYFGREHYRVIENFAELTQQVGRMAVFRPKAFDVDEIGQALAASYADWR